MTHEARFRALFDEHYPAVARYVLSRGHQTADADDLIAATFEVAWRRLDKVPSERDAIPWLLTVARNLSRNAQRKTVRERSFLDDIAHLTTGSTEMRTDERADAAAVMRALGELGTLDRDLVLLVAWEELSPSEAGRVLGLHAATARSRLHRARRRLSASFRGQEPVVRAPDAPASYTPPITETGRHQ